MTLWNSRYSLQINKTEINSHTHAWLVGRMRVHVLRSSGNVKYNDHILYVK